jgi:serine protease Do
MDAPLDLLHRVTEATVTVAARIPGEHPSAAVLGTGRFGTGSVISSDGLILTVNYVVLGAEHVFVVDVGGHQHQATVVAQDFLTGIALLRINASGIAALPKGDSRTLEVGDSVFMIAGVGNGERRSSTGVVTALESFDAYWEYRLERGICTTATNPGLAGGPLCDRAGRLVGVVSLNLGNLVRASLAIPAENFYDHEEEFLRNGCRVSRPRRAWVGMFCHEFPDRTIVAGLIPGAPGEVSGLMPGDLVVQVGEKQISDRAELYELIWEHDPGDIIELGIYREGSLSTVRVASGDAEDFFG